MSALMQSVQQRPDIDLPLKRPKPRDNRPPQTAHTHAAHAPSAAPQCRITVFPPLQSCFPRLGSLQTNGLQSQPLLEGSGRQSLPNLGCFTVSSTETESAGSAHNRRAYSPAPVDCSSPKPSPKYGFPARRPAQAREAATASAGGAERSKLVRDGLLVIGGALGQPSTERSSSRWQDFRGNAFRSPWPPARFPPGLAASVSPDRRGATHRSRRRSGRRRCANSVHPPTPGDRLEERAPICCNSSTLRASASLSCLSRSAI